MYGTPHTSPILEDFPIQPLNPYGESKVMVETMLRWFDQIHGLRSVALRYFNASGADPEGKLGEEHEPETHLIPLLFRAVETGKPADDFRRRLSDTGRHLHPRLHPRERSGAGAHSGAGIAGGGRAEQISSTSARERATPCARLLPRWKRCRGARFRTRSDRAGRAIRRDWWRTADKMRQALGWKPEYTDLRKTVATAWNFVEKKATVRSGS